MVSFCASSPGKILWLGGYSVLEKGNVSFVSAVDRRITACVSPLKEKKVSVSAPQFSLDFEAEIANGALSSESLSDSERKKAKFVLSACNVCITYLNALGKPNNGFRISTFNDSAFGTSEKKTGLGSSAAVTVSSVSAILLAHGFPIGQNHLQIHNLSQLAHAMAQQKAGSGFDIASATYGSCEYSRFPPEKIEKALNDTNGKEMRVFASSPLGCRISPLSLPPDFFQVIAYTGKSISTSEMIAKISAFKNRNPSAYASVMKKLNAENKEAIACLKLLSSGKSTAKKAVSSFKNHFTEGMLITKKLGEESGAEIEPERFSSLISESESNGALVSKLPGAGGGDSIAAICIGRENANALSRFWRKKGLKPMVLNESSEGVRSEKSTVCSI